MASHQPVRYKTIAWLACCIIAGLGPLHRSHAAEPSPVPAFHAEDVSRRGFGGRLSLADTTGRPHSLAEFRGQVVLLYFGFTYCPDVCPTELARLAELRRRLGSAADRVRVIFVTLDPERDTAGILGDYAAAFDPTFLALSGPPEAIAVAAEEFRVAYQKVRGSAADRYTIDHSAYVYAIDPVSRLRLRFTPELSIEQMLEDVTALLREARR